MAALPDAGSYTSEIQSGTHGDDFQKELALIQFLRMRNPGSPTKMAYEMQDADKFDDVVLLDDERKEIHFIQAKHTEAKNDKVKAIDHEALFPTAAKDGKRNGPFDLFKYIKSYLIVNYRFSLESAKYAAYKRMYFYIFTNKDLKINENDWVTIEERIENEILHFPGPNARHLKMIPTKKAIGEICKDINSDMTKLIEAIKNLFVSGEISKILTDYSTPLNEVLTIDKTKQCKFSSKFNGGNTNFSVAKLCNLLNDSIDLNTAKVTVKTNFLLKISRSAFLPPYVSEDEVAAFFDNFTLSVGQPNHLRPIIGGELKAWMKTWMYPDCLGQLSEEELEQEITRLKIYFDNRNRSSEEKSRNFIKKINVEECLKKIECDMKKKMKNRTSVKTNEMEQYINRLITYIKDDPVLGSKQEYTKISDTSFVEQLRGTFKDHQYIVVVADPGMGKTSLLQYLAFEVQKRNDVDVFLVYCGSLVDKLKEIKEVSDLEHVLGILSGVLSEENCDIIRKAPVKRDSEGYSILLILDGFDEIHSRYTGTIMKILDHLSLKKSIQIMVSGRKHVQKILEDKFKVKSMFLEPFTEDDQIRYLGKIWNVANVADPIFVSYSKLLLDKFHSSISSNMYEISSFPLMVRMLAEVYMDKFRIVTDRTNMQCDFSENELNIFQLYEQFIIKCFFKKNKQAVDFKDSELESTMDGYILEHQLLAMKLLGFEDVNLFRNPTYKKKHDTFKRRCEQESEKSLLVKVVNNVVQFCHRSYCEYFIAKYICDRIFSLNAEFVIEIWSDNEVIRNLSLIKMEENEEYFEYLYGLCEDKNIIRQWACQSGCLRMVSSWKKHFKSFNKYELFSMLRYSEENGHIEICRFLIGYDADLFECISIYVATEHKHALSSGGLHGEDFQKKFSLTLFLRMSTFNSYFFFKLAYNMKEADTFGDVVLIDHKEIHFLQVKYEQAKDDKVRAINLDVLFPTAQDEKLSDDFDLFMCLKSYLTVNYNFEPTRYKQYFYIFTNKDLKIYENDWVTIEERKVIKILRFPGPKIRHLKLIPTKKAIREMQNYINKDFKTLIKAIKELFANGNVSQIIIDHSTPLRDVLTIDENNQCSFSVNFNLKNTNFSVAKLYNILLDDSIGLNTYEVKVQNNFLQQESRSKLLPPYVSEDEVVAFFENFTLSVGQPNEMRPIISSELKAWMKTWMMPNFLGQLSEKEFEQPLTLLENYFNKCNKPLKINIKSFLTRYRVEKFQYDINKFLGNCTRERLNVRFNPLHKTSDKMSSSMEAELLYHYYINRELKFEEPQDSNHENQRVRQINDTKFVEELRGKFKDDQIIVLVADPDMGKTSLLQYVAFEVQKQNYCEVFLVFSNALVGKLNEMAMVSDLNDVFKILRSALSDENCDVIKNAPFDRDAKGFSILLVLDAFDKKDSRYSRQICEMIKQISLKKSVQIIIGARMHFHELLEGEFNVRSLVVKPIRENQQIRILKQFCSRPLISLTRIVCKLNVHFLPNNYFVSCVKALVKEIDGIFSDKYKQYIRETTGKIQLSHFKFKDCSDQTYHLDKLFIDCRELAGECIDSYIYDHQLWAMMLLDIGILKDLSIHSYINERYAKFMERCDKKYDPLSTVVNDSVQSDDNHFMAIYLCDHLFTLSPELVIKIWSDNVVIRNLSMTIMERNESYFERMYRLSEIDLSVALWACENGCEKMVSSWKDNLKFFTIKNLNQMLEACARHGHTIICALLLGLDVGLNKQIASELAADNGHVELCELLCSFGTKYVTAGLRALLHKASKAGHVTMVAFLLEHYDFDPHETLNALHYAARHGNESLVKLLIGKKAIVSARSKSGKTPLDVAAEKGHKVIAELLIANYSDWLALTQDLYSALFLAAKKKHDSLALYFARKIAEIIS